MATRKHGDLELASLRRWLDTNQDSASEKIVSELEDRIARDYPTPRVLATNSCMGALHLALLTIGVGPGDEVIVDPIVVFGGMAAAFQRARPVFADVDPRTFNIDPESIRERVTPRTRAIICTHLFGSMCDMQSILRVAREHGLPVIEDCAHALFATQAGRRAGLFGDFAAFSFNHRKQLSTGQGGFLLINSAEYAEKSRDQGFGRVPARITWNYQMPGIVAALALAQWERAMDYVQEDHDLANLYSQAVHGCPWLLPQTILSVNWSAYHIWSALYCGDDHGIRYDDFMRILRENGGDYFLPSFIPMGAFGLEPSPVYRYPLFNDRWCTHQSDTHGGHFATYPAGLCPKAELLVPRLLNTVLSPVPADRVKRYAEALHKTVASIC